jgi:hypothetical protein
MATVRQPRKELLDVPDIVRQLREGPEQIRAMTAGLSAAELQRRPAPDEWSVNENLAHLRAAADVWGSYMSRIVAEDHPAFTSINPRARMRKTDYPELEFASSFQAFLDQRADLMTMIDGLSADAWARTATVKVYADRFEFSVQYYGDKLARHEAVHVPQIEGLVGSLRS